MIAKQNVCFSLSFRYYSSFIIIYKKWLQNKISVSVRVQTSHDWPNQRWTIHLQKFTQWILKSIDHIVKKHECCQWWGLEQCVRWRSLRLLQESRPPPHRPLSVAIWGFDFTMGQYQDHDGHLQGRFPVQTWASLSASLLRPLPPPPLLQLAHLLLLPLRLQPYLEPRQHQPQSQRTHVRSRVRWSQKNENLTQMQDVQIDI